MELPPGRSETIIRTLLSLEPFGKSSVKSKPKYDYYLSRKCRLRNGGHLVAVQYATHTPFHPPIYIIYPIEVRVTNKPTAGGFIVRYMTFPYAAYGLQQSLTLYVLVVWGKWQNILTFLVISWHVCSWNPCSQKTMHRLAYTIARAVGDSDARSQGISSYGIRPVLWDYSGLGPNLNGS